MPLRAGITLRWLIIIGVALVLLVALFYGEENFRGAGAWHSFKQAQVAEGEKLNLSDFVPPPVADEQNFAMTPLLRVAFDYTRTTNGVRWRDTNALQHLSNIRFDLGSPGISAPNIADLGRGTPVNLKAFADFYRGNTNYPQSAHPGNDAEDILTALGKFEPDLEELREAASSRAASRFPIEYSHEPPAEILLPHLSPVKGITAVCELRAVAELENRRSADALKDLQLGFRLSASLRGEPFLIDHLVRIATLDLTLQGVREGLIRHAWSDSQLAELETNLAKIDLLGDYEQTMRGERSLNISGLDYYRRKGITAAALQTEDQSILNGNPVNWMPAGWYYQNMTVVGEVYRDYILPSVDVSNRVVTPALSAAMMSDLDQRRVGPYNIFAKMLLPALGKASQRASRGQTMLDETRVACAIERYRIQHNDLPDTLDALAPLFVPRIPNDLFDGKPLRYKKNTDGTYLIYSIGWNEKDDGGVDVRMKGKNSREDLNQGDWVWSVPSEK